MNQYIGEYAKEKAFEKEEQKRLFWAGLSIVAFFLISLAMYK